MGEQPSRELRRIQQAWLRDGAGLDEPPAPPWHRWAVVLGLLGLIVLQTCVHLH